MGSVLLFNAPGQNAEFVQSVIYPMACLVYIRGIDQGSHLAPVPVSAAGNGRNHFKVPHQLGDRGFRLRLPLFVDFPAHFQEQCRFFQDPVPHLG